MVPLIVVVVSAVSQVDLVNADLVGVGSVVVGSDVPPGSVEGVVSIDLGGSLPQVVVNLIGSLVGPEVSFSLVGLLLVSAIGAQGSPSLPLGTLLLDVG